MTSPSAVFQSIALLIKGCRTLAALWVALILALPAVATAADTTPPNIIFILADDLGYGDLGCYGQKKIQTPVLDQMAAEGMKFTNFYAGATVCAPSRCVLMTGLHNGHAEVRGNSAPEVQRLRDEDFTIAEALQTKGYHTALIGKWGLGEPGGGEAGFPHKQGFDYAFGYLSQSHAHNYYPEILWRNAEKVHLRNEVHKVKQAEWGAAGWATKKIDYSHDLFMEDALKFLRQQNDQPFFLYLALTIPHANNEATRGTGNGQEVPDYGQYADKPWSDPDKGQAAMITRMDKGIGQLLAELKTQGLDDKTIVFFSSDNGPHKEGGNNPQTFHPSGPLRGMKRDLYEGGIRVPFIARWPGKIAPGSISDHPCYAGDFFATACELASIPLPQGLDSLSLVPLLTGHPNQQQSHPYLYWEFYEQGSKQAVRMGQWKAIRMPMQTGPIELYNLSQDLHEDHNLAQAHPDIVKKMADLMDLAHQPHPNWQIKAKASKPPKPAQK